MFAPTKEEVHYCFRENMYVSLSPSLKYADTFMKLLVKKLVSPCGYQSDQT